MNFSIQTYITVLSLSITRSFIRHPGSTNHAIPDESISPSRREDMRNPVPSLLPWQDLRAHRQLAFEPREGRVGTTKAEAPIMLVRTINNLIILTQMPRALVSKIFNRSGRMIPDKLKIVMRVHITWEGCICDVCNFLRVGLSPGTT